MILFIFLCAILYVIFSKFVKPARYWHNKQVVHVKPWTRFFKVFLGKKSFFESVVDAYNLHPGRRYYGSYQFFTPSLYVRDVDLIKQITVKDFDYFPDHMGLVNDADPVLGLNLFSLKGEKWRDMRSTLSPAFTSSKMKTMFALIQETAENFAEHFLNRNDELIELEMKDTFSRYSNDVIANCAFGIKCDSLKEESNEFFSMGTVLSAPRGLNILRAILAGLFPKFFAIRHINTVIVICPEADEIRGGKAVGYKTSYARSFHKIKPLITFFQKVRMFPPQVVEFFQKIVKDTISVREKRNITRPDMIYLLTEARKGRLMHENEKPGEQDTGYATVEESSIGKSVSKMEITDNVIVAQALVFFFAGFDTASTMLSFLFYELALNPDIQVKLQKEIDEVLKRNDGKSPYDDILKMKYLDQVISETLRKYPPGYVLTRICAKDYKIEAEQSNETDLVLEKGSIVTVPVAGIHRDPNYFPEPNTFDPERFSDENKVKIVAGSYMPFGSGPRNCIGSRFALLEGKTLVVSLLSRFEVVPIKRTHVPIKLAKTLNVTVKGGCWLGFKKRLSKT